MTTQNVTKRADGRKPTRREFLATGCMALSGAAVGMRARRLCAQPSQGAAAISKIDPGYVGPQFFDEREEQALMDVMESGSPFRYWGPGEPTKVLRFEENFAKYMGARFALGVTSGTAALDCAVFVVAPDPGARGSGA